MTAALLAMPAHGRRSKSLQVMFLQTRTVTRTQDVNGYDSLQRIRVKAHTGGLQKETSAAEPSFIKGQRNIETGAKSISVRVLLMECPGSISVFALRSSIPWSGCSREHPWLPAGPRADSSPSPAGPITRDPAAEPRVPAISAHPLSPPWPRGVSGMVYGQTLTSF